MNITSWSGDIGDLSGLYDTMATANAKVRGQVANLIRRSPGRKKMRCYTRVSVTLVWDRKRGLIEDNSRVIYL